MNTFFAYARANGKFGIRNHVAVISAMDNSNFIARRVAACVTGTVEVCPLLWPGRGGADLSSTSQPWVGWVLIPMSFAAVVVSMEPVIAGRIADVIRRSGKEVVVCSCDECGGTINTTCCAVRYAKEFVIKASEQKRVEVPVSELMLGWNVVVPIPSQALSATLRPVWWPTKWWMRADGSFCPETTEWMGAEEALRARAVTPELGQRIVDAIKWYEDYIISIGVDIKGTNPAPDNIKGGLSTIEEKALGAVEKGGTRPIQDLITYNGTVAHRGLTLLDASPGGVENTTSLTSIGCQIIIFPQGKAIPLKPHHAHH